MGKGLESIPPGSNETSILNVAYNHLQVLPAYVFHNNSYKNLKKILVHENNINQVSLYAFRGMKALRYVDMSNNNITILDPYTFKSNGRLQKLVLVQNSISFDRLQTFLVSHSLETLVLSSNKIDQIYELTFMGIPNLKNLMLNNNALIYLESNSFKPLKLHYLNLANTGVYRLSENMFGQLPRMVNLEGTSLAKPFVPPLRQVTEEGLANLIKIDKYLY